MKSSVSAFVLLLVTALMPSTTAIAQSRRAPQKLQDSRTAPSLAKIRKTEIITVDNWTVTCTQTGQPNTKKQCSAALKIIQTENKIPRVVFTWVIGAQRGKLLSVLSMPSGVLIAPGVQLSVGKDEVKKVGYSLCQPNQCQAVVPMDEAVIKKLSAAEQSEVLVYAVNGDRVKFTVNMKGFREALADLGK